MHVVSSTSADQRTYLDKESVYYHQYLMEFPIQPRTYPADVCFPNMLSKQDSSHEGANKLIYQATSCFMKQLEWN